MTIVIWALDLITAFNNISNKILVIISILFTISNILATISTSFYSKHKTLRFQNLNLGMFIICLSFFFLYFSLNNTIFRQTTSILLLLLYISIILAASLFFSFLILKQIPRVSNEKNKSFKQNIIIGAAGALIIFSFLRLISFFLNDNGTDIFNLLIFFFSIILSIYMSTNYFLKAYLIKRYDIDEPVEEEKIV